MPDTPTTVFHIGLPFTGLPLARDVLSSFPGCARIGPASHAVFRELCWELTNVDDADHRSRTWQAFLKDARRDAPTLLLSAESLGWHGRGGRTARRLHAADARARVVVVVREQRAVLRAMYTAYVMRGGTAPLPAWLEAVGLDRLRYDALVQPYLDEFGADGVLVMAAEQVERDPVGALRRLRSFVVPAATSNDDLDLLTTSRPAPDPPTKLLRRVNQLLAPASEPPAPIVADRLSVTRGGGASRLRWAIGCRLAGLEARFPPARARQVTPADQAALDHAAHGVEQSNLRLAGATALPLQELGYRLPT